MSNKNREIKSRNGQLNVQTELFGLHYTAIYSKPLKMPIDKPFK